MLEEFTIFHEGGSVLWSQRFDSGISKGVNPLNVLIGNVLLDFAGGFLSIAQLILDGATKGWSGVVGDPVKFALGFVSIVFDILFIVQHYVLYTDRGAKTTVTAAAGAEPPALTFEGSGAEGGIQVGIVGDPDHSVDDCEPLKGKLVDATVAWKKGSDLSSFVNGAVSLEFRIPAGATAFAFSI